MPKHVHRVGVHDAKRHLSRLLRDVEQGGEVVIECDGRPIARIVPAVEMTSKENSYGMFAGQFTMADDFDADSDELANLFGVAPCPRA